MKNNNWYNHIQSMKDNFSPIDRYLADTARDEKIINSAFNKLNHSSSTKVVHTQHSAKQAKEAADRGYEIKYKHMAALNNKCLSFLEEIMPEGFLKEIKDKNVNLKSPNGLGSNPIFNKILQAKPRLLDEYDKIVDKISEAIDPWVRDFYNSTNARMVEQEFLKNFGINEFFEYPNGIKGIPACKPIVSEIAEGIAKDFADVLDKEALEPEEDYKEEPIKKEAEKHEEKPVEKKEELSELEKALAKIKELEKANAEKDKLLEKQEYTLEKKDNIIDKQEKSLLEKDEIIKELKNNPPKENPSDYENLKDTLPDLLDKVKGSEEESLAKDKIIEDRDRTIEGKDKDNIVLSDKLSKEISINQDNRGLIQELREDKKHFKNKVDILEVKLEKFSEISEHKDKKIDELQTKVQDLILHNNSSNNNSEFVVLGNSIAEEHHLNISGEHNVEHEDLV